MARLDPSQRAREYRQRHRDDGWTRNEKQRLKQLERKANRAEQLASQPDQQTPMEVVDALPDPTSEYLGRSLVLRTPGGFRSAVNTAIQLADDSVVWSSMVMEEPPPSTSFSYVTSFPVGTINSLPSGISHKSTHDIWVTDQGDNKLYLASAAGSVLGNIDIIATFGSTGGTLIGGVHVLTGVGPDFFWWVYDNVTGTSRHAYLHNPNGTLNTTYGVGIGTNGNSGFIGIAANAANSAVYSTSAVNDAVFKYSGTMVWQQTFGGSGLFGPHGICVDGNGDVWVSDVTGHFVRKFLGSNLATQLVQINTSGVAGNADGQLNGPRGLHADASGRLFVCDTGNNRIQVFDLSGNFLDKFGAAGSGAAQFNAPYDVTVDGTAGSAAIFVADRANHRISKWTG